MKFPGRRKNKHYFPVTETGRLALNDSITRDSSAYIVGLDQFIVDVEAEVSDEFLDSWGLVKGESQLLSPSHEKTFYEALKDENCILGEYAGGVIGNTLHNYSILADDRSIAVGCLPQSISIGDDAFQYLRLTSSKVDLGHSVPCVGEMARAFCLVSPDRERTFAVSKGMMNDLPPEAINEDMIKGASALMLSSYLFRDHEAPMFQSAMKASEIAKENQVPIVFTLGTSILINEKKNFFYSFVRDFVNVLAMNKDEAKALIGLDDPLLTLEKVLDDVDFCLLTVGEKGLYVGALSAYDCLRETSDQLHSKSLSEYNRYEYSRAMTRAQIGEREYKKVYCHRNPFLGGPNVIKNTNGAGDAALSAVLHDIAANHHHAKLCPSSPKHQDSFLTYSSIHQISKYANRVSYEVLSQNSPRLFKALPEKEACLEESYWSL